MTVVLRTPKTIIYSVLMIVLSAMILSACAASDSGNGEEASFGNGMERSEEIVPPVTPDKPEEGNVERGNSETAGEEPPDNYTNDGDWGVESGQAGRDSTQDEPAELGTVDSYARVRLKYDVTDPDSIAVLVNKSYGLPEGYEPDDLVKVDIPFVYQDESVHSLREVAAEAVVRMFEASKEDGIELAGVSGYRSYAIQQILYDNYVKRDGKEAANRYSAKPGHSEHSTGLSMDVAGISGQCAAKNCFADTEEARWLAEHAHEFGFIIRYPQGKEEITGYQYEPWHLRYVGKELAEILHDNEWTMEEFFLSGELNPAQPDQ